MEVPKQQADLSAFMDKFVAANPSIPKWGDGIYRGGVNYATATAGSQSFNAANLVAR